MTKKKMSDFYRFDIVMSSRLSLSARLRAAAGCLALVAGSVNGALALLARGVLVEAQLQHLLNPVSGSPLQPNQNLR